MGGELAALQEQLELQAADLCTQHEQAQQQAAALAGDIAGVLADLHQLRAAEAAAAQQNASTPPSPSSDLSVRGKG